MERFIVITRNPIDEAALRAGRPTVSTTGAVVVFLGVVRGGEEGRAIDALEYETFQTMAEHQFQHILDTIEQRWPVQSVRLAHRVGVVKVGEPSLWVEVASSHRREAFEACQYLIDEMKRVVPIWKRPVAVD